MVGMPTRNVNSVAAARDVVPASSAMKIVAPERDVPGNTPATTCAMPTRIATVQVIAVRSPIAWALMIGAVWMVAAEYFAGLRAAALGERAAITWTVAILVGLAQVVAGAFPGTSRSAATIFVALLAGTTSRAAATEFAFLVGIPTMFAATGYELIELVGTGEAAHEDWAALGVAFAASAATAFVAVKWLLQYIQNHRFTAFALYRVVLGVILLALVPAGQ